MNSAETGICAGTRTLSTCENILHKIDPKLHRPQNRKYVVELY